MPSPCQRYADCLNQVNASSIATIPPFALTNPDSVHSRMFAGNFAGTSIGLQKTESKTQRSLSTRSHLFMGRALHPSEAPRSSYPMGPASPCDMGPDRKPALATKRTECVSSITFSDLCKSMVTQSVTHQTRA